MRLRDRYDRDSLTMATARGGRGNPGSHIGNTVSQAWKSHSCQI
jgi:hypothetical protein